MYSPQFMVRNSKTTPATYSIVGRHDLTSRVYPQFYPSSM
jgi:hypothetical protein